MYHDIRLSEKFLSFHEEIIDAQRFVFYAILSNYVRCILFCWDKHRDVSQTWFRVCMKAYCCTKHVCERKTFQTTKYISDVQHLRLTWIKILCNSEFRKLGHISIKLSYRLLHPQCNTTEYPFWKSVNQRTIF